MDAIEAIAAAAAVTAAGLFAGAFFTFSIAVMPGLSAAGDAVFTEAMHRMNTAIVNPVFLAVFLGTPVLALVHAALSDGGGAVAAWAGFAAAAAVVLITAGANIPLNNALDSAGPRPADPARVRAAFEARWVRWNTVRTVLSAAGLAALSVSAVLA
ncbi:anthrone oxygenase family protein [Nocardiopsis coralliicola]